MSYLKQKPEGIWTFQEEFKDKEIEFYDELSQEKETNRPGIHTIN